MPSIRKRGKSYELRASCGFDGRGKRIVKYKTYTPSPKMSEKNAEKEAYRLAILFEEQCKNYVTLINGFLCYKAFLKGIMLIYNAVFEYTLWR